MDVKEFDVRVDPALPEDKKFLEWEGVALDLLLEEMKEEVVCESQDINMNSLFDHLIQSFNKIREDFYSLKQSSISQDYEIFSEREKRRTEMTTPPMKKSRSGQYGYEKSATGGPPPFAFEFEEDPMVHAASTEVTKAIDDLTATQCADSLQVS